MTNELLQDLQWRGLVIPTNRRRRYGKIIK